MEVSVLDGLSAAQVDRRQSRHGPNALPSPPRRRRILLLVDQVRNPLILMLFAAAVVAGLVGDYKDTVVIFTVIVLNSLLGFVQEFRAEHSLESLRKMLFPTCVVRRDGRLVVIEAVELVPGDLVVLEAGNQVPADGRLVLAEQLQVDESALTGESLPTSKRTEPLPAGDAAVGDRWSMAFMNTLVTRGRGELVVTATGVQTELGVLADLIARTPEVATPIQRQLAQLGRRLATIGGVAVAVYLVLGLLRGDAWPTVLLSAVALAVAAVPEGLPVVVTVTLAVGVRRMARKGALVKHLASVETLGATSVVCTDKTGTLTVNQMTVRTVWVGGQRYDVSGTGYHDAGTVTVEGVGLAEPQAAALGRLAEAAALCNDSSLDGDSVLGDPMEAALLVLATKVGVDPDRQRSAIPRCAEIPFDARHRYMVTAHLDDRDPTHVVVIVKGALDVLLERCTHLLQPQGSTTTLDSSTSSRVTTAMHSLAADGLRVLAVAERRVPRQGFAPEALAGMIEDFTLLGLVGLLDPPRPSVVESIAACHGAGVDVKMITGDHAATAEAIAQELGIVGRTCTGAELDALGDDDSTLDDVGVFARVSPEHKLRIVQSLQHAGHVTAMTGDGVNDAPALRAADIGVAMGKAGTQVSRDAAAMVLVDDHFATIVHAVEAGRTIYANILSFLRFQLTTSAGAIASMLVAPLLGLPAPLTALQILWVNMIMDGPPALALGLDPPEPDVMQRPPRAASQQLLPMSRIGVITSNGAIMAAGTLSVLGYGTAALPSDQANTLAFTTFVLFQVVSALTVRSPRQSVFSVRTLTNRSLWIALTFIVAVQVVLVHVPIVQGLFETVALSPGQWLLAGSTACTLLVSDELRKLVMRRRP